MKSTRLEGGGLNLRLGNNAECAKARVDRPVVRLALSIWDQRTLLAWARRALCRWP